MGYRSKEFIHEHYNRTEIVRRLQNGNLHMEDAPAVIVKYHDGNYREEWYCNEELHRIGGPALTYEDGQHGYWINGTSVSEYVKKWLSERGYVWKNMTDKEKSELWDMMYEISL